MKWEMIRMKQISLSLFQKRGPRGLKKRGIKKQGQTGWKRDFLNCFWKIGQLLLSSTITIQSSLHVVRHSSTISTLICLVLYTRRQKNAWAINLVLIRKIATITVCYRWNGNTLIERIVHRKEDIIDIKLVVKKTLLNDAEAREIQKWGKEREGRIQMCWPIIHSVNKLKKFLLPNKAEKYKENQQSHTSEKRQIRGFAY